MYKIPEKLGVYCHEPGTGFHTPPFLVKCESAYFVEEYVVYGSITGLDLLGTETTGVRPSSHMLILTQLASSL